MSNCHDAIYGALLQEYNVARVRKVNQERSARIAALQSRADAEAYVAEVRAKIAASFAMPERSALPPVTVTGVVETEEYRIEKTIFESRPAFPVTSHLYIPKNLSGKAPAVLFLCGHSQEGKNCDAYRSGAATLAKNGFVVLVVDPVSQGERYQFPDKTNAANIAGFCTREHNMRGKQLWLCDEFFGSWRAHDALCGLDYLLSRQEVDTSRVGITGNSGGGTMTTFVQALDPRFTMAAPSCYVTSWRRNIENELPADVEQIPPGILAAGCEMGDFVLAYAPRPILLLGQKNDFFDPRGLKETYEECRKVYALLGAEENLRLFIGPTDHGYSVENRRSMYEFFDLHAAMNADKEAVVTESDISALDPRELLCTPEGQVYALPGKKLISDLIAEKLDEFAAARKKLSLPELKEVLTGKLGFPANMPVPYCRTLRLSAERNKMPDSFLFSRFALENVPGMLTVMYFNKDNHYCMHFPEIEELTIFVPHLSAGDELPEMSFSTPVAGVDVRGIGVNRSCNCDVYDMDNFFAPYGADYHFNSCDIMFGSSQLHGRVADLLGAIAYVKSCGVKKIRLAGRGLGALTALFAAIICEQIESLKLFDAPESFESMARANTTLWPHSVMPRGILKYTDLPDMYGALKAAGKLEIVNFTNNFFRNEL